MNNTRRGLPLARARIEQIFPKLTPTQIRRITPHGRYTYDKAWRSTLRAGR